MEETWQSLSPHGRNIFYEGTTPDQFCAEVTARYGFNPAESRTKFDGVVPDGNWDWDKDRAFWCPPEHLDSIYGSGDYPMGS